MRFPFPSRRAALLCATLLPAPLWADVSPEDVWQNMQDMVQPMGISLNATTNRSGDTLTLEGVVYQLNLPFDAGQVDLSLGRLDLKDRGDGTVAMLYPANSTYALTFTSPEGVSQSGSMTIKYDAMEITASGNPGYVTYDYDVARMDIALADIVIPDVIHSMSMEGFVEDYKGSFRAQIGDMVEATGTYTMGLQEFTFSQSATEEGIVVDTQGKQGATSMAGDVSLIMPRSGMSILNLAAALRDGLAFTVDGEAKGYFSDQTSSVDGQQVMAQSSLTENYELRVALDKNGLAMSGPMRGVQVDMQMVQPLPMQLGLEIASGSADILLPLLKSEEFAPYRVNFDLMGVSMDDSLWAMFDAGGVLPRAPADIELKAHGHARNRVEWLDFLNVESEIANLTGLVIEPQDLTLERYRVSAAGAEIIGKGAVTFDNSGTEPLPIGTATFEFKGLNALIARLIEAGLITDQDATSARMGMAMMAAPAPSGDEDHLISEIEMTAEGHVYVNGNRMK